MSIAEETREAVRQRPFLLSGLRAGVVNYTGAARSLAEEVGGDPESIATALRRFADSLPERATDERDARVSMESGLGVTDDPEDALLTVGDTALAPGEGSLTAIVAEGDVDSTALAHVLARLDAEGVEIRAGGVAGESLLVAVERREGPDALRIVEDALTAVPE